MECEGCNGRERKEEKGKSDE
ncbi:uncharacterized protein G2W53_011587 [Senna tora]|uniref:Uncharacterized protein n=1 Tax=Senna tora TaxID=362788 RepID=A0A834X382_9FABA|nr:uncharacterized protein G2W53_011587 [Senna tora]